MRVAGVIKIVAPEQWRVPGSQHRKFITIKDTVAVLLRAVAVHDQLLVPPPELFQFVLKSGFDHWAWAVVVELADGLKKASSSGSNRQPGMGCSSTPSGKRQ